MTTSEDDIDRMETAILAAMTDDEALRMLEDYLVAHILTPVGT